MEIVRANAGERASNASVASAARILVPTKLGYGDRAAILLGLQMAAKHGGDVTVLHVVPDDSTEHSVHWLDAIDNLHRTMNRPGGRCRTASTAQTIEQAKNQLQSFLENAIPRAQRESAHVRSECRVGDIAEEIGRFADEVDADLVILGRRPAPWWALPFWPGLLQRILHATHKPVVLVRPESIPPTGSNRQVARDFGLFSSDVLTGVAPQRI